MNWKTSLLTILVSAGFFGSISPPSHAQLDDTLSDRDLEGRVQICLDCKGRLFVNGVPVSVADLDLVLTRLKSAAKPLHYKVKANTDAKLETYLKVRNLFESHNISPEYKITFASRRSLCR